MIEQLTEKMKVLKTVVMSVEKQFGKGAIMSLGDEGVPTIPTGSLALDLATGVGGYPRGRVVEVYGPESSGKTTLTLHAIAQAQRNGGVLGVETRSLSVSTPSTPSMSRTPARSASRRTSSSSRSPT